jgi:hypothetical protein
MHQRPRQVVRRQDRGYRFANVVHNLQLLRAPGQAIL